MEVIGRYLLQLTAAAILCRILMSLAGAKGSMAAILRLMTGIFMTLTMVGPLLHIRIADMTDYFDRITVDADYITQAGVETAKESLRDIIKERAETYILDKAGTFGAELTVEVSVDGLEWPVPSKVSIRGSISPYGKKRLQALICEDLGIPLEEQVWT